MSEYELVKTKMYDKDAFSQWLGIEIITIEKDNCILRMEVRPDMLNGFNIAHGGIAFSLADSALAFAANACGNQGVTIDASMSHLRMVKAGDILQATTSLVSKSRKFALYRIEVIANDTDLVASFSGRVYYNGKKW